MADLTKEQKLSGLTGVTDIVDLLSKVNLVQYKTGWTSKHLAADAIREITRLRQLLSEAEKREAEARAKALEEAAQVAEAEYKRHCTGSGFDSQPARSTAHRILEALKALQSQER
ncbi:hypothetical protein N5C81_14295 [Rhizobium pusense]|uniref:hypothetical protein n=1 Tax=Agrobacterium pusense TaxID=648995 RepID=UPI0024489440|nr:hypothetical protein [Agrobacterium pusense]MDH1268792.1 hypothetical protein [Agrobacterium pusense]